MCIRFIIPIRYYSIVFSSLLFLVISNQLIYLVCCFIITVSYIFFSKTKVITGKFLEHFDLYSFLGISLCYFSPFIDYSFFHIILIIFSYVIVRQIPFQKITKKIKNGNLKRFLIEFLNGIITLITIHIINSGVIVTELIYLFLENFSIK